jgi:H/ACA ribonucleoprotein complex subunit 3
MNVYIKGQKIPIHINKSIGKGGEADIFDIGGGRVLKLFKPPNHIDYEGNPLEQKGAEERIKIHQKKLPSFPRNLPKRVITPKDLATNARGDKIVGFTMDIVKNAEVLLQYSNRSFRQQGISNQKVVEIFKDLHETIRGIHSARTVIGDFNDLNILVKDSEAYFIDADSFQFGNYLCGVFTSRFVDPLLCDPKQTSLMLQKPHNINSDWYAFCVILMQCLLFVDPYGGIYKPKNKGKKITQGARPLHRITVFNPEVRYPKPAIPYKVLPDDLLHFFTQTFEKDKRGEFPFALLESLIWTNCSKCGASHARSVCPECSAVAPNAIKKTTVIRGNVTALQVFGTKGVILFAALQRGKLQWLYHENDKFLREDKSEVIAGKLDPHMRFRIRGNTTLMAKNGQIVTLTLGKDPERLSVDSFGNLPMFDANDDSRYWINAGQLLRDGQYGSEYIGDVLDGQTLFWVGPKFGFGFYRAGSMNTAFVFDAKKSGINDSVKVPSIRGQLVDSTCIFSETRCWFFIASKNGNTIKNQCFVIKYDGTIEATHEAEANDGSWLSTLRGKCLAGKFALAATDDGIVRLETQYGKIVETKKFPDTEPFVDSSKHLFPGKDGLYVVGNRDITILKIR